MNAFAFKSHHFQADKCALTQCDFAHVIESVLYIEEEALYQVCVVS